MAADVPLVAAMIRARCGWLEERGLPSWRASVDDVAAQAENTDGTMWVLEDGGRIVGCTTVQDQTPPWGWTPEELAEPAYYLYTSVTDPAFQRFKLGTLMAWWAVDRAAREDRSWVRRGCMFPGLVRYYERQGFTLYHEVRRTRNRVFLMGRRAERIAGLERMFAVPGDFSAVTSAALLRRGL
nr:GNAT family N-acetyltransferase [Frankia sp. Cppng1_Ct_nod]